MLRKENGILFVLVLAIITAMFLGIPSGYAYAGEYNNTIPASSLIGTWNIGNGNGVVEGYTVTVKGSGTVTIISLNETAGQLVAHTSGQWTITVEGQSEKYSWPDATDTYAFSNIGDDEYLLGTIEIKLTSENTAIITERQTTYPAGYVSFQANRSSGKSSGGGGGCSTGLGSIIMLFSLAGLAMKKEKK